MKHGVLVSIFRPLLITVFAGGFILGPGAHGNALARPAAKSPVYLTTFQNTASTFQRNFNPFMTAARMDFTQGGIYEPLMIYTTAGVGHAYPWLATGYKWLNHNRSLLLTIRSGVKWSDGKPFTPADVVFTFNYGKKYAPADETGLMQSKQITKISQVGAHQVLFKFASVNTTVLPQLLSTNSMMIPQHIWSKINNPSTWLNTKPVGTGPFARVIKFSSQQYILGKNPYYWQKLSYDGIRVPALSSNDATLAAADSGQLDWTGNFFSNVQKTYINHDPSHFHAFYSNVAYPLGIYFNTQKYPFSLYPLREAISMAIDRSKINTIAENGNEPPTNALAMEKLYPAWVDPKLKGRSKQLASYDPSAAKQVLTKAGFTYKGQNLYDPKGNRVSLQLSCPSGWDDWVTTLDVTAKNLQDIGIDAGTSQSDATGWLDQRSKRLLDGFIWSPLGGISVYNFFNNYMPKTSYFPVGQNALASGLANLSGWYSDQATTLLQQFRETASHKKQLAIAYKLEKIQLDNLPFAPTVYAPYWYTYSTKNFSGFPNKQNNYANGSTYLYPDNLKILTSIHPAK
jgi:peptide/nickel transport system substrate-binding protein